MTRIALSIGSLLLMGACAHRVQSAPPIVVPEQPHSPPAVVIPQERGAGLAAREVEQTWQHVIAIAIPLAEKGEFAAADSALASFAHRYDATCQAAEAGYYRALLHLTPANRAASPDSAAPLLDRYMTSVCVSASRRAEITLLRKLATTYAAQSAATTSTNDEELKKLREQLDATKKELERLRLRVIPPESDQR